MGNEATYMFAWKERKPFSRFLIVSNQLGARYIEEYVSKALVATTCLRHLSSLMPELRNRVLLLKPLMTCCLLLRMGLEIRSPPHLPKTNWFHLKLKLKGWPPPPSRRANFLRPTPLSLDSNRSGSLADFYNFPEALQNAQRELQSQGRVVKAKCLFQLKEKCHWELWLCVRIAVSNFQFWFSRTNPNDRTTSEGCRQMR